MLRGENQGAGGLDGMRAFNSLVSMVHNWTLSCSLYSPSHRRLFVKLQLCNIWVIKYLFIKISYTDVVLGFTIEWK